YGSPGGLQTTPSIVILGAHAGDNIAGRSIGDVNGYGLADFAILSSGVSEIPSINGSVTIHYGGGALPDQTIPASSYGFSSGTVRDARYIGDANGDGYSDVLVDATDTPAGSVWNLFLGSSAGLSTTSAWSVSRASPYVDGGVGDIDMMPSDVNGDGF